MIVMYYYSCVVTLSFGHWAQSHMLSLVYELMVSLPAASTPLWDLGVAGGMAELGVLGTI